MAEIEIVMDTPHREGCRAAETEQPWVLSGGTPVIDEGKRWSVLVCNDSLCRGRARFRTADVEALVTRSIAADAAKPAGARRKAATG